MNLPEVCTLYKYTNYISSTSIHISGIYELYIFKYYTSLRNIHRQHIHIFQNYASPGYIHPREIYIFKKDASSVSQQKNINLNSFDKLWDMNGYHH